MPTYESEIQNFNSAYPELNFNIKEHYEIMYKMSALNDFTVNSNTQKRAQSVYRNTLTTALIAYLESRVEIADNKDYSMSDINIINFIEEFDKVIHGIRSDAAAANNQTYTHTPIAGTDLTTVAAHAWRHIRHFNNPLHGIWASQIRKGTLSVEQLQNIASSKTGRLDAMTGEGNAYLPEGEKDLADVVMIRNAMESAINKRSWISYLNPLNWGPYGRERSFLKQLNEKIDVYKASGFPVSDVVPKDYTKNMLSKAHHELIDFAKANNPVENQATVEVKPEKTEAKKKDANNSTKQKDVVGKVPTKEVADALLKDKETVKANLFEVVGDYLDAHDKENTLFMYEHITKGQAEKCWDAFNKATDEAQKRAVLADYSKKMFKGMYDHAISIRSYGKTPAEKLVMTQKLADFVLNTYFPVASNSKYAEFGNNYYLKNTDPETLSKDMFGAFSPEDLKPALEQARFERGVTSKMPLDTSKDFVDKAHEKASKINNISAPTKSKGKDSF